MVCFIGFQIYFYSINTLLFKMNETNGKEFIHADEDHWWRQIPMSQLFTPQNPLPAPKPPDKQEEKLATKQQKKKSRGNRAEQHFKRRLNRRNLDEASKTLLIEARMENKEHNVNKNLMEINPMDDDIISIDDQQITVKEFRRRQK